MKIALVLFLGFALGAAAQAPLDVKAWQFRKPVQIKADGVQELELDPETLAHAASDCRDLRLVRNGQQWPYVLEQPVGPRRLVPEVQSLTDPKRPTVSQWKLKLPQRGVPVTRLQCHTSTAVFNRRVTLLAGRKVLATADWVRAPGTGGGSLVLDIAARPDSDQLVLETDNGDNPPLVLDDFSLQYQTARLLFQAPATPATELYYGNPRATPPSYDLAMNAGELRRAAHQFPLLGTEERLREPSLLEHANTDNWLFWGALALVVLVLIGVVARLLPKAPPG
jgi:hypothetical protein